MIKIFCDGCDKDLTDKPYNKTQVPYHVTRPVTEAGYTDAENNRTSGKCVHYHFCNDCNNRFYYAAYAAVFKGE